MEKGAVSAKEIETNSNPRTIPPTVRNPSRPASSQPRSTTRTASSRIKSKLTAPFRSYKSGFPFFPELPTEIRLKIWEETIEPRVHELHPCANLYNDRMTFRSNAARTPSIFHVNQESRLVAEKHYRLMKHTPSDASEEDRTLPGKCILRFYFAPKHDTLLLNSLMGLFMMFMLLEDVTDGLDDILSTGGFPPGIMAGWERVAIDADRARLITLLAGAGGRSPQPKFKKLIPDLKELVIAFDHTRSGKTRFRTSVWPGENGTSLGEATEPKRYKIDWMLMLDTYMAPLKEFLKQDYMEGVEALKTVDVRDIVELDETEFIPRVRAARVERKKYIRGDLRYAFRWSCALLGMRPRGVFRRL